ncbi:hypothetical protein [Saccharothrix sp. HUAS TT1]|uniref:hypothetical protein n=1 Tax=unclassified Saccharothrix TaxID=2593673 RepID=UPI00345BC682
MSTVLVLVALTVAAWAHGGDGGDPNRPRAATVAGDPRLPWAAEPSYELVEPVGTLSVRLSGPPSVIEEAGVLGRVDLDVVEPVTKQIAALVSTEGELVRGAWLFTVFQAEDPTGLLDDIVSLYEEVGYQAVPAQEGVVALAFAPEEGPVTYRGHYVSGRGVVRVEAFGPDGDAAEAAFHELLAAQLRDLPVTS